MDSKNLLDGSDGAVYCVICGCSEFDPCIEEGGKPCGWEIAQIGRQSGLCTACSGLVNFHDFNPEIADQVALRQMFERSYARRVAVQDFLNLGVPVANGESSSPMVSAALTVPSGRGPERDGFMQATAYLSIAGLLEQHSDSPVSFRLNAALSPDLAPNPESVPTVDPAEFLSLWEVVQQSGQGQEYISHSEYREFVAKTVQEKLGEGENVHESFLPRYMALFSLLDAGSIPPPWVQMTGNGNESVVRSSVVQLAALLPLDYNAGGFDQERFVASLRHYDSHMQS